MLLAMILMQAAATPAPEWQHRPDGQDVRRYFPEAAQKQFQTGRAAMRCDVTPAGLLSGCVVESEVPAGIGFGEAALRMSPLFKMRRPGGGALEGGVVTIPIRFGLPPDVTAGPLAVRDPALSGAVVDVNCRYRGSQLDDCESVHAGPASSAADLAAIKAVMGATLPAMPRPAGRVLIAIRFEGGAAKAARLIEAPDWLRRPNGSDVAQVIPAKAARAGLSGEATTSCHVTANGELAECVTVSEAPLGAGFGEAALKLMPRFRMKTTLRDGQPVEGGTVRIPMRFQAPR